MLNGKLSSVGSSLYLLNSVEAHDYLGKRSIAMTRRALARYLALLGFSGLQLLLRPSFAQTPQPPATAPPVGFPDATNTGVPPGVALTPYNENLVVNTPGAVISGLDIHGIVQINAPNVTLMNSKVTGVSFYIVGISPSATGATVKNCTIDGTGSGNEGSTAINGAGTFLNNNIYNVENGFGVSSNTTIENNYVHDLLATGSPHYDGVQIDGGVSNVTIKHNTIINSDIQTSAVMIDNWAGPVSNIIVENNRLIGGGYTVYSDGRSKDNVISGVVFINNRIGKGHWGYRFFAKNAPVWRDNVDDVTGRPLGGR